MKEKKRLPTDGGSVKWTSPFTTLKEAQLPMDSLTHETPDHHVATPTVPKKHRGRVDILRQTAHRCGKTVTVITGLVGIGKAEKEALAQQMQKVCGAGGTLKDGRIEIQGDQRDAVALILVEAGFRLVLAGG